MAGRKPLKTEEGERLLQIAVKIFPHQWTWLKSQGNASEWIRSQITKAMAREKRKDG